MKLTIELDPDTIVIIIVTVTLLIRNRKDFGRSKLEKLIKFLINRHDK